MARSRISLHTRPTETLSFGNRQLWLRELGDLEARLRLAWLGMKAALTGANSANDPALWGTVLVIDDIRDRLHALTQDMEMMTRERREGIKRAAGR